MSAESGSVTLEFIGRKLGDIVSELRAVKATVSQQNELLMLLAEQARRTDRHVLEVRDDLELSMKAEIMGRLGHFETLMTGKFEDLEERLAGIGAVSHP